MRPDELIAQRHDYVWARLPFVLPMAITAARRRGDQPTRELARLVVELSPLLFDHMTREEALFERGGAPTSRDGMHADHVAVTSLLEHIRAIAGIRDPRDVETPTERALYNELAELDHHVQAQILLEERLLSVRCGG